MWAGVVLKGGKEGNSETESRIQKALESKIARYKIPEKCAKEYRVCRTWTDDFQLGRIVFAKAIPKTATGKIQRRHIREAFVAQVKASQPVKAKL